MNKLAKLFIFLLFITLSLSADVENLRSECKKITDSAKNVRAVKGLDGWLYSFKEFQHMSRQKQWTEQAVNEIKAYNEALKKEGIKLIVIPVPPKVSIYPEHLSKELKAVNPYKELHKTLADSEVKSVDLFEVFTNLKKSEKAFCKQDSHFSPEIAVKIASHLCITLKSNKKVGKISVKKEVMKINGDLRRQLEDKPEAEKLSFSFIEPENPAVPDSDSQVLLLGDSNLLIYHKGGDMLARGAGIADHLSAMLGKSVDLLAVKGSGINISRLDLYRRFLNSAYLKKKKTVIWCFSAYELTETENWKRIPVRR